MPRVLRLLANRKNCLKSTGPKTPAGKARAARNNTRHGFYSHDAVLIAGCEPESREEYAALARDMYQAIRPRDDIEVALTARIVAALWQSRRALRYETACLSRVHLDAPEPLAHGEMGRGEGFRSCVNPFSHAPQRESLPATDATGGSSASGPLDPFLLSLPADKDLALIVRYENRADRQLHQALAALRRHRATGKNADSKPITIPQVHAREPTHRKNVDSKPITIT